MPPPRTPRFAFLLEWGFSEGIKAVMKNAAKAEWSKEFVDVKKAYAALLECNAWSDEATRKIDKLAHKAELLAIKERAKAEKKAAKEAAQAKA